MSEPHANAAQTSEPAWVVRGNPTDEELAAVLLVLSARRAPEPAPAERPRSTGWSAYWRGVRTPLVHGPGAWRAW